MGLLLSFAALISSKGLKCKKASQLLSTYSCVDGTYEETLLRRYNLYVYLLRLASHPECKFSETVVIMVYTRSLEIFIFGLSFS